MSRPRGHPPKRTSRPPAAARAPGQAAPRPTGDDGKVRLYGLHAVKAALANPQRRISLLMLTENAEDRLGAPLAARRVQTVRVSPRDLDHLLGPEAVHQGVLAETEALPEPSLADVCRLALSGGPLVVLDQVTDPHNVGAILRSAAVFGAAGLVMTRRHSPPLGGALAKAASGALELVPVALVVNLARALDEMAEAGLFRLGLDGEAEALLETAPLGGPLALVLGAEGKGLRRLTRDLCDGHCRIGAPGSGSLASLNVSNAAAVALYAASQSRRR